MTARVAEERVVHIIVTDARGVVAVRGVGRGFTDPRVTGAEVARNALLKGAKLHDGRKREVFERHGQCEVALVGSSYRTEGR